MLAVVLSPCLAALLFVYLFMPALWMSIMSVDDSLDAHEKGLAVVALRHPVRENEVACMAKLLMLRHKIHQTNTRRRRSVVYPHAAPRSYTPTRPKANWVRFRKPFGAQHH